MLNEVSANSTDLDVVNCDKSLDDMFLLPWKHALKQHVILSAETLLEVSDTLHNVEEQIVAINKNITNIVTNVQKAGESTKSAAKLENFAATAAEDVVAEALQRMVVELCNAATELLFLRSNVTALSDREADVRRKRSIEAVRVMTMLDNVTGKSEMPHNIEESFTSADRKIVVLTKLLRLAVTHDDKVVGAFCASKLSKGEEESLTFCSAIKAVVDKISSSLLNRLHPEVCTRNDISKFLASLKSENSSLALLKNAGVLSQLVDVVKKALDGVGSVRKPHWKATQTRQWRRRPELRTRSLQDGSVYLYTSSC
ncbi:hypothetical protein ERJ75_000854200 [Trypanosoma vivax]|nr:hypothetical protein ERJ75_000854200 [Trypanosoma vivax]